MASRKPVTLAATLNTRLVSYAAAASAAGVGMLGWALPAEAEIVYTPSNIPILRNTPLVLDLNHDGVPDFVLSNKYSKRCGPFGCFSSATTTAELKLSPAQASNAAWGASSSIKNVRDPNGKKIKVPVPLPWGLYIAQQRKLLATNLIMDYDRTHFIAHITSNVSSSGGPWGKGKKGSGPYMGLKFMINGEAHYGWARFDVLVEETRITATLTGYAYETNPNTGIVTGVAIGAPDGCAIGSAVFDNRPGAKPPTLGRLAEGATGLRIWRGAQNATPASGLQNNFNF